MDNDKKNKFWDKIARFYTYFHEKGNRKLYEEITTISTKFLKPDMVVLELGCGTGLRS